MATERNLGNKAPITEALIDFRVALPEGFEASRFQPLLDQLKEQYPLVQGHQRFTHPVGIEAPGEVKFGDVKAEDYAFFLRPEDQPRIVQLRTDGFTFNQLPPYTSWNDVFSESWRLWLLYREVAEPEAVPRIAARYINGFEIEVPVLDWTQYLTVPVEIPRDFEVKLGSFLAKYELTESETGLQVNLALQLKPPIKPNRGTLVIDIDVYKGGRFETEPDAQIKSVFQDIRALKNRLFFESVTEKLLETLE